MLLDKVVIGSTVEALLYSFLNDYYFLSVRQVPCLFYRSLDYRILDCMTENEAWEKICFIQGLLGKLLTYEDISGVRIESNTIKILSEEGVCKHSFSECFVFDTSIVESENEIHTPCPPEFLVLDDFELSQMGGKHKYIKPRSHTIAFAGGINFYSSDRVDGADYITDCVVESRLDSAQLHSFDFSDTMARFEVERYLKDCKVYGTFMNFYKNGKPKYRKPKVKHIKRFVFRVDQTIFRDSKLVKFVREKPMKEIFDEISTEG
jgi:hypothetical protein